MLFTRLALSLQGMKEYTINVRGALMTFDTPRVMGILNVTPDSFYQASRVADGDSLSARARKMIADGADILDIGACSTRPGGAIVSEDEELRRLHAALDLLDKELPQAVVSVDTFRARVARECADRHNVAIINDVSGFSADASMLDVVAQLRLPYVLTHSVGSSDSRPHYENFMPEVLAALSQKMWQLRQRGVADVIIDPGFGFGKSVEQNFTMLASLPEFAVLDAPVLVGVSRKSMITKVLGVSANDALNGTTTLNSFALMGGAHILRVHDVAPAVEAVRLYKALRGK